MRNFGALALSLLLVLEGPVARAAGAASSGPVSVGTDEAAALQAASDRKPQLLAQSAGNERGTPVGCFYKGKQVDWSYCRDSGESSSSSSQGSGTCLSDGNCSLAGIMFWTVVTVGTVVLVVWLVASSGSSKPK